MGSRALLRWASSLLVATAVVASGLVVASKVTGALADSSVCGAIGRVDGLTISRVHGNRGLHPTFPAKVVVTSRDGVQEAARALCTLPAMPSGPVDCPADFGVSYLLTFTVGRTALPPVTVEASGCQIVLGLGQTRFTDGRSRLWTTLGAAAGVTDASLQTFLGTFR